MSETRDLLAKVALLEQLAADYESEKEQMVDVIDGLQQQARSHAAKIVSLNRELSGRRMDEPRAAEITFVLEAWRRLTGHKGAKIGLDTERAQEVKRALKDFSKEELVEALQGLALLPYVVGKRRSAVPSSPDRVGKERFDQVKHAFGAAKVDHARIENWISRSREARSQAMLEHHGMYALWEQVAATERHYFYLVLGALAINEQLEQAAVSDKLAA